MEVVNAVYPSGMERRDANDLFQAPFLPVGKRKSFSMEPGSTFLPVPDGMKTEDSDGALIKRRKSEDITSEPMVIVRRSSSGPANPTSKVDQNSTTRSLLSPSLEKQNAPLIRMDIYNPNYQCTGYPFKRHSASSIEDARELLADRSKNAATDSQPIIVDPQPRRSLPDFRTSSGSLFSVGSSSPQNTSNVARRNAFVDYNQSHKATMFRAYANNYLSPQMSHSPQPQSPQGSPAIPSSPSRLPLTPTNSFAYNPSLKSDSESTDMDQTNSKANILQFNERTQSK